MYELPIPTLVKQALRHAIPHQVWLRLKDRQRAIAFNGSGPHSFDEAAIFRQIEAHPDIVPFFVDIGAQDGVLGSQTLGLAKKGWSGVNYETDSDLVTGMHSRYATLPQVKIRREFVTPDTASAMLDRDGVPQALGFLSLDIDSYDFHVLASILEDFAPTVICVEINEMIPPPVVFAVDYRSDATWLGDRFQGFSIQAAKELCLNYGYRIGELHYNNLLLVRTNTTDASVSDKDILDAYRSGYVERADRAALFPWNREYEDMLELPPAEVMKRLANLFAGRLDRCRLELAGEPDA